MKAKHALLQYPTFVVQNTTRRQYTLAYLKQVHLRVNCR